MYLYKQKTKKGDTYLAIKEKYYVAGSGAKERTVEKIGYLSELCKTMNDPIAYYTDYAKKLTEEKNRQKKETVTIDLNETMDIGTNSIRNVGYGVLKWIYKELELDRFWNWKTRNLKAGFSTDKIFKLLEVEKKSLKLQNRKKFFQK